MRPDSEAALAEIIREASAPLTLTGGATRLHPGEGQGGRLDMTGLNGITLYQPEALTLVVRAGTPLQTVTDTLAAEGQMLGFEPDLRPGSTIGGVVAANASGPRRVLAGAARDAALGVRFVDGTGEIVKNGGRVMKNVTGYDLVKLMTGSRGQLGALTEVALRTAPIPPARVILRLPDLAAVAALPALIAALSGPFDVSAAGWTRASGALLRLEGLPGSVTQRRAALTARLAGFGEITEAVPEDLLLLCPNTQNATGDLWRIICHPSAAPALLARLPAPLALDWGGALIWIEMPPGEVPDLPVFDGHATRVTGAAPALLPAPDPLVAQINRDLQTRFDPRGLFAGGR